MPKKLDPFAGFTPLEDYAPAGGQLEHADTSEPPVMDVTDRPNKRPGDWPASTIDRDLEKLNNA